MSKQKDFPQLISSPRRLGPHSISWRGGKERMRKRDSDLVKGAAIRKGAHERLDKDELYKVIKKYGLNDKWRDYKRRGKR